MYTRITRSGGRQYLQLVEGYRDAEGKVKQRVIASLGRLDKLGADDLDPLIRGLQRAVGRPEAPGSVPEFEPALCFGDLWALHQLWGSLGLGPALRRALRGCIATAEQGGAEKHAHGRALHRRSSGSTGTP